MATFSKSFSGVPAGEIYPVDYQPGDACPPELEAAATELGALETAPAPDTDDLRAKGKGGKCRKPPCAWWRRRRFR
jgi:hypothetical protein